MTALQDVKLNADHQRWYIPNLKDCDNMNKTVSNWERVETLRLCEKNRMHKRYVIIRALKGGAIKITQDMEVNIRQILNGTFEGLVTA